MARCRRHARDVAVEERLVGPRAPRAGESASLRPAGRFCGIARRIVSSTTADDPGGRLLGASGLASSMPRPRRLSTATRLELRQTRSVTGHGQPMTCARRTAIRHGHRDPWREPGGCLRRVPRRVSTAPRSGRGEQRGTSPPTRHFPKDEPLHMNHRIQTSPHTTTLARSRTAMGSGAALAAIGLTAAATASALGSAS